MTAWPDPSRPGVPLNPERDGWHWLRHKSATFAVPYEWRTPGFWVHRDNVPMLESEQRHFALDMIYLGPCLTPAEHAAAVQAALARAERLAGALRPFAIAADDLDDPPWRDDSHCWESPAAMSVTAGDFRRARAALAATAQGGDGRG